MRPIRKQVLQRGFSLIEVAIATCIIGVGVTSLMALCQSCTQANEGGGQLSRAAFLAQEVREWTVRLPFSDPDEGDAGNPLGADANDPAGSADDLDDLMNVTYDPPRNAHGTGITDMAGWSEQITLTWVNPGTLAAVAPGGSDAVRVDVSIHYRGMHVFSTSWLVIRRQEQ